MSAFIDEIQQLISMPRELLIKFRDRYDKSTYPGKIVQNLFYEAYTANGTFDAVVNCLDTSKFQDFYQSMNFVNSCKENYRRDTVMPNLVNWMNSGKKVWALEPSFFTSIVQKASHGDNKMVEEIEYAYQYDLVVFQLVYMYLGSLLLGMTPNGAFSTICHGQVSVGGKIQSFNEVTEAFYKVIAFTFNSIYRPMKPLQ